MGMNKRGFSRLFLQVGYIFIYLISWKIYTFYPSIHPSILYLKMKAKEKKIIPKNIWHSNTIQLFGFAKPTKIHKRGISQ